MSYDEPKEHWPAFNVNMQLLSGMIEVGEDLYLTGSFGGFGGSLHSAHRTFEAAKTFLKEYPISSGASIYKLTISSPLIYIGPEGQEVQL